MLVTFTETVHCELPAKLPPENTSVDPPFGATSTAESQFVCGFAVDEKVTSAGSECANAKSVTGTLLGLLIT